MFSVCSSLTETANAVKPQVSAVHAGGSPPALGLMGEKNDQRGCSEHARKPDESRIDVALVHAGKAFKTRAGNALPSVKFRPPATDCALPFVGQGEARAVTAGER